MRIGEVAALCDVSTKTIRFYEQTGVLCPPARTAAGYREYESDVVGRLAFIRSAQAVGLTLNEIRGIIEIREEGSAPCSHVLDLLGRRTAEIDAKIDDLRSMKAALEALTRRGVGLDPEDCRPSSICRVICTH